MCYQLLLHHWQDWPACVTSYCSITDKTDQHVLPVTPTSLAGLVSVCYQLLLHHWQDWPACYQLLLHHWQDWPACVTSYCYITGSTDQRMLPVTVTSLTGQTSMCYQLLLHHSQDWPACVTSYCYIIGRTDQHVLPVTAKLSRTTYAVSNFFPKYTCQHCHSWWLGTNWHNNIKHHHIISDGKILKQSYSLIPWLWHQAIFKTGLKIMTIYVITGSVDLLVIALVQVMARCLCDTKPLPDP